MNHANELSGRYSVMLIKNAKHEQFTRKESDDDNGVVKTNMPKQNPKLASLIRKFL